MAFRKKPENVFKRKVVISDENENGTISDRDFIAYFKVPSETQLADAKSDSEVAALVLVRAEEVENEDGSPAIGKEALDIVLDDPRVCRAASLIFFNDIKSKLNKSNKLK